MGYEKACIFHKISHGKKLSKLLKLLSNFKLKQNFIFFGGNAFFWFFFKLQNCQYVPVVCIIDSQIYKKLRVNILMKKFIRHLEIEKNKTKPGNSLWKFKISAKIKKNMHFRRIFNFSWNFELSERISGLSFDFFDFKVADEFLH